MDMVANLESGNRNIAQQIHDSNTDRGTPAGGFFQIIDPTWARYAQAAGVDLKQYPTAMSAPRNIQAQVASAIPVNQWGPNTVNALKNAYPGLDTSQTLGQVQSAALGGSGAAAVASGSPTAAPGASTAVPGPLASGQPPGASTGSLPGFTPGSPAEKNMQAAMKQFGGGQGDQGGQDDKPFDVPASPMIGGAPTPSGGRMMMGAGGQNTMGAMAAQQQLAQEGYLTQPSLASFAQMPMRSPIGAPPPGGSAPAQATGMPGAGVPGTTLNSPSQLQYALMTGYINPYDMYGQGGGYGAGMNSGSA
jgi:hypothetical protein